MAFAVARAGGAPGDLVAEAQQSLAACSRVFRACSVRVPEKLNTELQSQSRRGSEDDQTAIRRRSEGSERSERSEEDQKRVFLGRLRSGSFAARACLLARAAACARIFERRDAEARRRKIGGFAANT